VICAVLAGPDFQVSSYVTNARATQIATRVLQSGRSELAQKINRYYSQLIENEAITSKLVALPQRARIFFD
jgi:hypothetical protein